MTHSELLEALPFDLYERYSLLEHISKLFRPVDSPYRVLDVGGQTPAFWPGFRSLAGTFIPDAQTAVVDLHARTELYNYVRAGGCELPFRDGTFDLVCSFDTLEHVPSEQRPGFLSELLRVTRDGLYLAFPFDSPGNRWAESVVVEHTNTVLKCPIPALLEHREFGLPERESIARIFAATPHAWLSFVQGNTDLWLMMMLALQNLRPAGDEFVRELNRRFNHTYAGEDWGEPCYRAGYLLSKKGSLRDLDEWRALWASTGKRADPQAVALACHTMLGIARCAEVTRPLESRIRNLEIALLTNQRAIQSIFESRIWKVLCILGGLLLRVTGRGVGRVLVSTGGAAPDYQRWIAGHELGAAAGEPAVRPVISIAVPVYKTPIELLTRCIESVRDQTYSNWELCLADDGSQDAQLTAALAKCREKDSRIKLAMLAVNRGVSAATNAALGLATGEYVAFLDHDDELAGFALSEVVRAINEQPETELFYSDEDKIDEQGRRYDPFFKPDWSPELLLACNYIGHFVVMKRSLWDRLGGLDEAHSGAQDYDLMLRAGEHTRKIRRIPKVLYHWRAVTGSTAKAVAEKPGAGADGRRALAAYAARNAPGAQVEEVAACRYRVRYPISGEPRVSILMPTAGKRLAVRALEEVIEKTAYRNYEIVLIDNSRGARVEQLAAGLAARQAPVRYLDRRNEPFNFSRMNNVAARTVSSPYLLFLNDDITVITSEWLTALLEQGQQAEVGAVGARLWYPDKRIQHAGVVMGLYGNCSHAFRNVPGNAPHYYFDFPNLVRNCSAVTGACLLIARSKFIEAGAFDEVNLAVAYQDVDLCLKLLELGYRNVYTPYAHLYHHESATKTAKEKMPDPAEDAFMRRKWAKYIADDPYYNPNLTRRREDFTLAME